LHVASILCKATMAQVIFDSPAITVACISDTHNDDCRDHIPDADILVHAGDMTDDGTLDELKDAYEWISALPHKVKVIVAGKFRLGPRFVEPASQPAQEIPKRHLHIRVLRRHFLLTIPQAITI
jgi:hypothetical protein